MSLFTNCIFPLQESKSKYDDIKNVNLFRCSSCNKQCSSAKEFRDHVNTADHQKMLDVIAEFHEKTAEQFRSFSNFSEFKKTVGKSVRISTVWMISFYYITSGNADAVNCKNTRVSLENNIISNSSNNFSFKIFQNVISDFGIHIQIFYR